MTRFYVGQRVRIVGPSKSGVTGKEATIIEICYARHARYGLGTFNRVNVDGFGCASLSGLRLSFPDECLEPTLPPGQVHQPADMTISELLPFLDEVKA